MKQKNYIIAGIMSGSSLDGVDIAVCTFSGRPGNIEYTVLSADTISYNVEWIEKLPGLIYLDAKNYEIEIAAYSRYLGNMIDTYLKKHDADVDLIGSHGHTLLHIPEKDVSVQIGNGGIIASITGIDTMTDFRIQDVAHGGQGAPLAPLVEHHLYKGYDYYLNLGGIANLSHHGDKIVSWDVCPCNQVLDHYAKKLGYDYDEGGKIAASGKFVKALADQLITLPYFGQSYPKSLDNNWIKEVFIPLIDPQLNVEDVLHTFCKLCGELIAKDIQALQLNKEKTFSLLATGGGAFNDFMIDCIKESLASMNIEVVLPDPQIISYKEAILMALMAYLRLKGEKNTLSTVTGAQQSVSAGAFYRVK